MQRLIDADLLQILEARTDIPYFTIDVTGESFFLIKDDDSHSVLCSIPDEGVLWKLSGRKRDVKTTKLTSLRSAPGWLFAFPISKG